MTENVVRHGHYIFWTQLFTCQQRVYKLCEFNYLEKTVSLYNECFDVVVTYFKQI